MGDIHQKTQMIMEAVKQHSFSADGVFAPKDSVG
jgi:hypothetical protein